MLLTYKVTFLQIQIKRSKRLVICYSWQEVLHSKDVCLLCTRVTLFGVNFILKHYCYEHRTNQELQRNCGNVFILLGRKVMKAPGLKLVPISFGAYIPPKTFHTRELVCTDRRVIQTTTMVKAQIGGE